MHRYLRLLRRRDYALLWGGATASALGDGMSFVALIWLVLERGGDSGMVGWLAASYTAPVIVGGLAAGIILDRFDRRRVLAADNLIRGTAIASVPLAAALGVLTTPHLFLVTTVYGLLYMTSLAGVPSMIPSLVDADDLTTANAMESLTYGIAGLAGPAVAGVVIAVAGAPAVLALDALSYGIFVVCLVAMRGAPTRPGESSDGGAPEPSDDPEPQHGSTPPDGRDGHGLVPAIRFILGARAIVAITVMYMILNVCEGIFIVLAPLYARDVLEGGATTYGVLVSSLPAGSLVGAFAVGAIGWRWPLGRSIALATLAAGLVQALLLATPSLLPTMAILFAVGLLTSSLTAWAQTIRMRLIPPELRGRVFALLRTLMQATTPIGAVLGGVLLTGGAFVPAIAAIAIPIIVAGAIGLVLPALGPVATGERLPVAPGAAIAHPPG